MSVATSSSPPAPSNVLALGAASVGTVAWRVRGQLRLTVVVKASFALVPGATMTQIAADDIVRSEVHQRNVPTQSVRLTSDLAPFLPVADAVLTGYAHAPEGAPAQALTVRFGVFRERALIEKIIHVYGDRSGEATAPFEQMPLVYERTFGGLGSRDNPFGTGNAAGDKPPNLVDPADPTRPACFAPISASWPSRKRMIDRAQQEGLRQPILDITGELDWQYFNAAPFDQRIPQYLKGNEWVVLDGMHPTQRSVQSRLPDVAAAARVYGLDEETASTGRDLALVADTLRVDAERMTCSLVWRGHVPVPDEAALGSLEVVGGVAFGSQLIEWPARLEADAIEEYKSISGDEAAFDGMSTVVPEAPRASTGTLDGTLDLQDGEEVLKNRTLPFSKGPAVVPQGNPAPVTTGGRSPAPDRGATVTITPEQEEVVVARFPVPFAAAKPAASPATPPPPSPFAFGLSPAPLEVEPVGQAPTFLKKAPNPLPGAARAPVVAPAAAARRRKAERVALGIELFPEGPLAIGVVPWGLTPSRDTLTVIAKATCDLASEGPAVARPAADPLSGEVLVGPRCVYPSDLVPFKTRADVVLVGHAIAPGGSTPSMEVTFRFGGEGNAFARSIVVYGDRCWKKGRVALEPSAPEPFARMAVAFDHAFGGPRFEPNPAGLGHHDPMRRGPVPLPNLEDADQILRSPRQAPPPAVFAPIPLAWKDRWAARGEGGLCLAEALDWTRYQAAPRSQQLAFLRGDEPFSFSGLSARHPVIEGALPGIHARCFAAWKAGDRFDEVTLRLDTAVFDADAMTLSLVWRGALPVADEQQPEIQGLYLLADRVGAETPLAEARARVLRV